MAYEYFSSLQVPTLDIGTRIGHTHYIDFLRHSDMAAPIMKGTDTFNRPFISIEVRVNVNGHIREDVGTFFQRYTDDRNTWTFGTNNVHKTVYNETYISDHNVMIERLNRLMNGETLNDYDPYVELNEQTKIIGNGNLTIRLQ